MRRAESLLELIYYQIRRLSNSIVSFIVDIKEVDIRLTELESIPYEVTYRQNIDITGTTTGQINFPVGTTLDTNDYPGNAVLSLRGASGEFLGESPRESDGSIITASLDTLGNWSVTGTTPDSVDIVFRISLKAKDLDNLVAEYVIDYYKVADQKIFLHSPALTNGQTVFNLPREPKNGLYIDFYINGQRQSNGLDYTISGSTISFLRTDYIIETTDHIEFIFIY